MDYSYQSMNIQMKNIKAKFANLPAALLLLCGFALASSCLYANKLFFHDDTYIMLRYSRNFMNGEGIVWNPGELVEGYTSFLHLLLASGLTLVGVPHVATPRVVNFIFVFFLVVFCCLYLFAESGEECSEKRKLLVATAAALICSTFPLHIWALGGLEAPVFAFLSTTCIWCFARTLDAKATPRGILFLSSLFALACLARPEGILFYGVSLLWMLAAPAGVGRKKKLLAFCLPLVAILGAHTAWRFTYYGDFLPNTYYVKATGLYSIKFASGINYLLNYAMTPPFLLPLLLTAVSISMYKKRLSRKVYYLLSCILPFFAYLVYVGGDHMPSFRLLLPIIPSCILALHWSALPLAKCIHRSAVYALCATLLVLSCLQLTSAQLNPKREDPAAFLGKIVGEYIAEAWPKGSLVALATGGSTPYYASDHVFIDLLGLNDRHIGKRQIQEVRTSWQRVPGHSKGDGAYVLSRQPDYIILGHAMGTQIDKENPWFLSDLEMKETPSFYTDYQKRCITFDLHRWPNFKHYPWLKSGHQVFTYYERKQ